MFRRYGIIIFLIFFPALEAHCERVFDPNLTILNTTGPDQQNTQDLNRVTGGAQGTGDSDVNGVFQGLNRSGPQFDQQTNSRGREYKAGDAEGKSALGKGVAIATGAALMAKGISLLPFPTTPRGVALIAKAALEFAQAGADAGTQSKNGDQRELLTLTYDEGNPGAGSGQSQNSTVNKIKSKINTPELQNFLAERGINSDDFIVPMTFAIAEETTDKLDISLAAQRDAVENVTIKVVWGTLQLTTPIQVMGLE